MIIDLTRAVTYICPLCSTFSTKALSIFELAGKQPVVCFCETAACGEQAVKLYEKKNTYIIEIECPVCGEQHSYTVKRQSFWTRALLTLKCPASDINIFFVGTEAAVRAEADKTAALLAKMMEDMDLEDELHLMYDLIDCINELSKAGGISCRCGGHNIGISAEDRQIVLTCRDCRTQKHIEASLDSLIALLNTSTLVLDDTNSDHK